MVAQYLPSLFSMLVVKPLIILGLIIIAAAFIKNSSAARQHFLLALGVFSVLLLPVLQVLFPVIEWSVPPDSAWLLGLGSTGWGLSGTFWPAALVGIYLVVALWLLFYLVLGLIQLRQDTRSMVPCTDGEWLACLNEFTQALDIEKPVTLVMSDHVESPYMWGYSAPVIVLPASAARWPCEDKRSVLIHELAHVVRNDWLTSMGVRICCAVFWFLPPLWWVAARLNHFAELACDDYVYRLQDRTTAYAETLLALSCTQRGRFSSDPILSMARRSPIFIRIQAVLDAHRARYPVTHQIGQYWVLTLVVVVMPLASIQAVPKIDDSARRTLAIEVGTLAQFPLEGAVKGGSDTFQFTLPPETPPVDTGFNVDIFEPSITDSVHGSDMTLPPGAMSFPDVMPHTTLPLKQ